MRPMFRRPAVALAVGRLLAAALVLAAVITDLVGQVGRGGSVLNFLSFFTIETNLIAAAAFLAGGSLTAAAVVAARRRGRMVALDHIRGAATVYLLTTGIVFDLLLAGLAPPVTPWVNAVLHRLMPVLVPLDWLVDPPGRRIRYRRSLWWLAFPLAWLGYTLIRGAAVGWYPYPFVDPRPHGYGPVAARCVVIGAGMVALTLLVAWAGNELRSRRAGRADRAG